MMKTIVTHFSPDLDAITGVWLVKKFFPGWQEAEIVFVPAGETFKNEPVDVDPTILHIDTGLGKFDHHQLDEDTCAAKKVLCSIPGINRSNYIKKDEALERLVEVVNDIDHFREVYFPNPTQDFYDFGLPGILDGWKLLFGKDDHRLLEMGMLALEGVYKKLKDKIWAEKLLKEEGVNFKTRWGRAVAVETGNDEVLHLAQKQDYKIVVRKDPKKGNVRIKSLPDPKIDLTPVFKKLKKKDPQATWFLHIGKHMILNGSMKNPKAKPTKLTLKEIIKIIKNT